MSIKGLGRRNSWLACLALAIVGVVLGGHIWESELMKSDSPRRRPGDQQQARHSSHAGAPRPGGSGGDESRPSGRGELGNAAARAHRHGGAGTNRLAGQTSHYLLLHKDNPVHWYPWGPEAFARAVAERKPIFLSIGYSSCYWCHVMERESFSDPAVAAILNEHFICIKVDREELPDVDHLYMTAVQIMGLGGGWPLSVFLTPEGKAFFGGTYWPAVDRAGLPSFTKVLQRVIALWRDRRRQVEAVAEQVDRAVRRVAAGPGTTVGDRALDGSVVERAVEQLRQQHDPLYGGFGPGAGQWRGPKFPQPPKLALMLIHARRSHDQAALGLVLQTLNHMAGGGIWDHLGGGFHRYSTDRYWQVPHFEKMLYDNAQLARVYLAAFEQTGQGSYRRQAERIFEFVGRRMTSPEGGFYASLDAESEGQEGRYYVWGRDEVKRLLGERDYRLFAAAYGLDGRPNFEGGRYVLHMGRPLAETAKSLGLSAEELQQRLSAMRGRLLQARRQRPAPALDTTILTDWNGLMIAALADGYRLLGQRPYRAAAEAAANMVLERLRDRDGNLWHAYAGGRAKVPGYLEDYAYFIDGLLALHEATGQGRWLDRADELAERMVERFWDPASGGFYSTGDGSAVPVRFKTAEDSVRPSGNGVAVQVLVALAVKRQRRQNAQRAARTLLAFRGYLETDPAEVPSLVIGLAGLLDAGYSVRQLAAPVPAAPVVQVQACLSADQLVPGRPFQLVTTLTIRPGWHLNANPPALENLVPAAVELRSALPIEQVRSEYPPGTPFRVAGVADSLTVYSGRVTVRTWAKLGANAPAGKAAIRVLVRYQACDAARCLAPQQAEVSVPVEVVRPN